MFNNVYFMRAYINLLRSFETDIKPHGIKNVLDFIKNNKLAGDNDYELAGEYISYIADDYYSKTGFYKEDFSFKEVFYEEKLFKLIKEKILKDADEFFISYFKPYFKPSEEIYISNIINLKNNDEKFYIENQEEVINELIDYINEIDFNEIDEEAEDAYYKREYQAYFAFKFLVNLLYQNNLKKAI